MRKNSNDSSRILLVCLGLNVNHNKINSVNTAFIYKLFSEFGSVQKILIFTKKDILKSFVEFKSFESSERAKKALHNKVIGDMGKARLYFSNRQEIERQSESNEYWESEELCINKNSVDKQQTMINRGNPSEELNKENRREEQEAFPSSRNLYQSTTNHKQSSNSTALNLNLKEPYSGQEGNDNGLGYKLEKEILFTELNEDKSAIKLDHSLKLDQSLKRGGKSYKAEIIYPSRVVEISQLQYLFNNSREIHNLLSCFGNINMIILFKEQQTALVEFYQVQNATESIVNLDRINVGPVQLSLRYSQFQCLTSFEKTECLAYRSIHDVFRPLAHRFDSSDRQTEITASNHLHLTFKSDNEFKSNEIINLLKAKLQPSKIRVTGKDVSQKNLSLKFSSLSSAIYIIYKFHGIRIGGTTIAIGFI